MSSLLSWSSPEQAAFLNTEQKPPLHLVLHCKINESGQIKVQSQQGQEHQAELTNRLGDWKELNACLGSKVSELTKCSPKIRQIHKHPRKDPDPFQGANRHTLHTDSRTGQSCESDSHMEEKSLTCFTVPEPTAVICRASEHMSCVPLVSS